MEPRELAVLGAIARGVSRFDRIQGITGLEPAEINEILRRLEGSGLVMVVEKKGWLGKKVELEATDAGMREVEDGVGELEARWGKMASLYKSGSKDGLRRAMDENRQVLPAMMFFGVMDMAMFGLMFGLIGAAASDYVPSMPDADSGGDFDFDVGF